MAGPRKLKPVEREVQKVDMLTFRVPIADTNYTVVLRVSAEDHKSLSASFGGRLEYPHNVFMVKGGKPGVSIKHLSRMLARMSNAQTKYKQTISDANIPYVLRGQKQRHYVNVSIVNTSTRKAPSRKSSITALSNRLTVLAKEHRNQYFIVAKPSKTLSTPINSS